MEKNLKLIAILPQEPYFSEIRKEQEYIATTWGPVYALRTPPHITIVPPVSLTSSEVGWLFGMAGALSGSLHSFNMELHDYGSFKPRVIFINTIINKQLHEMYDLWHQSLLAKMPHVLDKYPDRPYHPHLTLAHKDVTTQQFDRIWRYYDNKKYRVSFRADHFCILNHTENGWVVEKRFPLLS